MEWSIEGLEKDTQIPCFLFLILLEYAIKLKREREIEKWGKNWKSWQMHHAKEIWQMKQVYTLMSLHNYVVETKN